MKILVLGGTSFVGRAIVIEALSRGHEVTTFTRTTLPPRAADGAVETIFGDRLSPDAYDFAKSRTWDVVIDTWFGAPKIVHQSATALQANTSLYAYVSTCSVYEADPLPFGIDEDFHTVEADPNAESTTYPADKRGAELALFEVMGADRTFISRPGLIIGPHEWPERLTWWLSRIKAGGEVLAPGPKELPLQYIDARDLAAWVISGAENRLTGIFNTLAPAAHCTWEEMLEACKAVTKSDAQFTWVPSEFAIENEVGPWREMPIWITPEMYGFYNFDTSKAQKAGLTARPMIETVRDTWFTFNNEPPTPSPAGRVPPGIDREKEMRILESWRKTNTS